MQALLTATEGWATGLYLASLAGRGRPFQEWPALVHGDRREIAAFLTSEALENQPAEIQEFLLHTSILDYVEPAACRALTGRADAHDLLLRLARENLFVTAVADQSETFRYHPLFAELLRLELAGRDAETAATLHRRASEFFSARGDLDAALRHRLAAGDVAEAAEFVAVWWRTLWEQGLVETTRRWLASFSDEQILAHAPLTSDGRLGVLGPRRRATRRALGRAGRAASPSTTCLHRTARRRCAPRRPCCARRSRVTASPP